ncbi:uncharacterized protein BO66DRAFT_439834 [Aspergillus aculeatinus CBS 121060]|uniref:Uncharacterized protein n=1 Tax=Aspergillus aculeatinus CBS 121060 TaxID=1448322 RepID=A0ACD1H511_9EURO|nr:hypothetical protein BO66DRAFT_439834 [Aspergillus aculeatinus CBS 121060]RAH68822.1 hypothetical protein BO66DRAFT_439834 [Aspergillus aculeatinus CBS 121060]
MFRPDFYSSRQEAAVRQFAHTLSSTATGRFFVHMCHELDAGKSLDWEKAAGELGATFRGMRARAVRPLVPRYAGLVYDGYDGAVRLFTEPATDDEDPVPFTRDGRVEFRVQDQSDRATILEWAVSLPACVSPAAAAATGAELETKLVLDTGTAPTVRHFGSRWVTWFHYAERVPVTDGEAEEEP